jgi:predicted DNA-binding protein (MmcQ/YjbR family)
MIPAPEFVRNSIPKHQEQNQHTRLLLWWRTLIFLELIIRFARKSIMDMEAVRAYLLAKVNAVESAPFGSQTLTYRINGQVFALITQGDSPLHLTLRCDPERALLLRGMYHAVRPGVYMNKRHWNTVTLDGSIPTEAIIDMIEESYALTVQSVEHHWSM